jgi:phosphoribosylformylglycinamidine cyclo-ligase
MLRTFNCGVGMLVVVPEAEATALAEFLTRAGETVFSVGVIAAREGETPVVYSNTLT